jgi:rRNA maturation RNase YbeY
MITFDVTQDLVPKPARYAPGKLRGISKALDAALGKVVTGVISVSLVDDAEIRRLNRMYRDKDKVTDVLSFASPDGDFSWYLGDVIISYPQAVRQAEDEDLELELTDLLVHGILHVLGYDHEKAEDAAQMFPLQDTIVAASL